MHKSSTSLYYFPFRQSLLLENLKDQNPIYFLHSTATPVKTETRLRIMLFSLRKNCPNFFAPVNSTSLSLLIFESGNLLTHYCFEQNDTRGKEKIEQPPCERLFQGFEFSRTFLPPVSHGVKCYKFQKPVNIVHIFPPPPIKICGQFEK